MITFEGKMPMNPRYESANENVIDVQSRIHSTCEFLIWSHFYNSLNKCLLAKAINLFNFGTENKFDEVTE